MSLNLSLKDFLKYLSRFKWMLILIPLLCVIVTYFFVKELPKNYKSEALISTGLTSRFEQTALAGGQNMDYFKLSQQFGNLLEMIKSKRNINLLSYKLILHDLKDPDNAFQPYSKEIKKLSEQEKQIVIAEFEKKYSTSSLLSLADNKNLKLFDIMKSTGYGEKNLLSTDERDELVREIRGERGHRHQHDPRDGITDRGEVGIDRCGDLGDRDEEHHDEDELGADQRDDEHRPLPDPPP